MKLRIKSSSSHVGIVNKDTEIEIPNKGCPQTTSVGQLKALVWKAMVLRKEAKTVDNTEQLQLQLKLQLQTQHRYEHEHEHEYEYLRLICKGRLLAPDDSPLSEFKVVDNDVVHAVLSKAAPTASTGTGTTTTGKPALLQPGSNCHQQQQQQQQHQRRSSSAANNINNSNNSSNSSSIPQLLQHQRRRRQRPNRGIGTIVGPGGRVTRDSNTNNDDDSTGSSSSDNDYDNGNDNGNNNDEALRLELWTILTGTHMRTRSRTRTRRERRGFDLLRGPLSRHEITAIRTYFNRYVDRYIQQQQQLSRDSTNRNTDPNAAAAAAAAPSTLHMDEPDLRRRRLLVEEEWMRIQGPTSEFRLNLNQNTLLPFPSVNGGTGSLSFLRGGGSIGIVNNTNRNSNSNNSNNNRASGVARPGHDRDFVWGFCLGFFVGLLSLVWVWIPTVPHKKKLGILTGICFQVLLDSTDNNNNSNSNSNYYDYAGEENRFVFDNGGAGGLLRGTRLNDGGD